MRPGRPRLGIPTGVPFRSVLRLSLGEGVAKTLHFLTFVYLARVLGVTGYGRLELALAILSYFALLADGGLELWATREAARTTDPRPLVARVLPLRGLLALAGLGVLLLAVLLLHDEPPLRLVLLLFGLTLLPQAVNLKWVFMGQERMGPVATGLIATQIVFTALVLGVVRGPEQLLWVPALRVATDVLAAGYFFRLFAATYGPVRPLLSRRAMGDVLRPALTMGAALGFGLMNYNFDSLLLGLLAGVRAVGWYGAAYKPVTAALAMPVTFFLALFPVLSRTYAASRAAFGETVTWSLQLTAIAALPVGVGGTFFATPLVELLFGPDYAPSAAVLRVLCWSAVFTILRGTYKHGLNAAGLAALDLRCAAAAAGLNLVLNLLLIPRHGILGAALATTVTELAWLGLTVYCFDRAVMPVRAPSSLLAPLWAAFAMAAWLLLTPTLAWPTRALVGALVYAGALVLAGGRGRRGRARRGLPVA